MELEINISEKDLIEPDRSDKGRKIILGGTLVVMVLLLMPLLGSGMNALEISIIMIWILVVAIVNYKFSKIYFEFASLYRKKLNPDFPLTKSEANDMFQKSGKFWYSLYMHPNPVIFKHVDDPQLSDMARTMRFMFFSLLFSPIAVFILMLLIVFLTRS